MSMHSPGPWTVGKPSGKFITDPLPVWANDAECGDKMPAEVYGSSDARQLANAKLIAAAPDMLDALIAIRAWIEESIDVCESPGSVQTLRVHRGICDRAIEKAKPPERSPRVSAAVKAAATLQGCQQP